jgi:hypothetical protein
MHSSVVRAQAHLVLNALLSSGQLVLLSLWVKTAPLYILPCLQLCTLVPTADHRFCHTCVVLCEHNTWDTAMLRPAVRVLLAIAVTCR